jgi:hypothetical protein
MVIILAQLLTSTLVLLKVWAYSNGFQPMFKCDNGLKPIGVSSYYDADFQSAKIELSRR